MENVIINKKIKIIQENYKNIIQDFLNTYEEGEYLSFVLLALFAEIIKGIMKAGLEHIENDSVLTKAVILDIIISVNRKYVDMLATNLNDISKKTGSKH